MMRYLFLALLGTALCASAFAQAPEGAYSRRTLTAVKLSGPAPMIDGEVSDAAWTDSAAKAETFIDLQISRPTPDQTIARLTYDATYLYVAFDCKDSDPSGVVGRETIRDSRYQGGDGAEDYVEITFDPFLTFKGNDFSRFSVNPLGTRSARISGGRAAKAEWNGDWEAAARRTPTGWSAEMRIPWATLNYPAAGKGKTLTMGINFTRFQYRTRVTSLWSDTTLQGFGDREGRWVGVEVPRGAFRPTLSLLPYSLSFGGDSNRGRFGVDARYTATPDFSVVASLHPDFATVEGAVQSVSFSRAEQFVDERRPFFLEGGDYFHAGNFYSLGPLFYTNRIENFDFGVKAFGKLTPRDSFGFLVTQDLERRSDTVLRYRRDLSPTDQIGVFGTFRDQRSAPGVAGDRNGVGGVIGSVRRGRYGVEANLLSSMGREAGGRGGHVNFQVFDGNHFTSIQYLAAAPTFRVANGLVFFNDYKGFSGYHNWSKEWRGKGTWRGFNVDFGPEYKWHYDGRPYMRSVFLDTRFETRSDWSVGLSGNYGKFDQQSDRTIGVHVRSGVSNRFRQFGLHLETGIQADRAYRFLGPSASLRIGKALDLGYESGVVRLGGAGWSRQHIATLAYQLSRTRSIGGRLVQQNDPGKPMETNAYLSFRNAGERGVETYFLLGDPNAQTFTRQAALKLIWAM